MKHTMIDIETLDTCSTAAVLSIGACIFDPNGDPDQFMGTTFYDTMNVTEQLKLGRTESEATKAWWAKQEAPEAVEVLVKARAQTKDLRTQLLDLREFFHGTTHIWANSPSFDVIILKSLFEMCEVGWPYSPFQELDVRTFKAILSDRKVKPDVAHHALYDAVAQAKFVLQVSRDHSMKFSRGWNKPLATITKGWAT